MSTSAVVGDGTEPEPSADLAVGDAARRVGVAGSTLRTWERRYGVAPSRRTAGGHRRYTVEDVAALQRLRQLSDAGMTMSSAVGVTRHGARPGAEPTNHWALDSTATGARAGLDGAVSRLDGHEAAAVATAVVAELGVIRAWTDVFVPHLQAAGEHWQRTGEGVEREHLAVAAVLFALTGHARSHGRPAGNPRLLAAGTPGEQHTLPLDALAAALADSDVGTCVLGTLPPEALHAAVRELAPSVVVLWAHRTPTADEALLAGMVDRVPLLCAAGPGWSRRRLPRAVTHLEDLATAVESVLAWTRQ
jgi:hypothetical protein